MRKILTPLLITGSILSAQYCVAEEVKLQHNGITLNGNLELTDEAPFQRIFLITHGTLAYNGMEIISSWQSLLLDEEISSLAINLSLGQDDRHGMYDCPSLHNHKHTDAIHELGSWVNWLKEKGAEQVILAGHSRGANQTAWFSVENQDPVVHAQVLLAPQTWSEAGEIADYTKRYQQDLAPLLEKAHSLPKNEVLEKTNFIYCAETQVTAESVIGYYEPDTRLDTPTLLKESRIPTLVFSGSEDTTVSDLTEKMATVGNPQVQHVEIEGADHFFRDLYLDEVLEYSLEFLDGL